MKLKNLIKSNYLIVPSLLNNKSAKYDMEWSVGAKLFLEGHGTARWNGSEINNLNQVQFSWRY